MVYTKNLPGWERGLRLLAALGAAGCAWHFHGSTVGLVFGIFAGSMALTAFVGFCPMCALAGRKLDAAARRRGE